ncbi:hypothetical protein C0J52_08859 [Blattella germanica]|nr:hypothetical protein C0J52_08859 [Blattella germanica]
METIYDIFYYSTICHVCKCTENGENQTLKRCGGCKLVSYCSTNHQKIHWPIHRKLCKCIQSYLRAERAHNLFQDASKCTSYSEWCKLRTSLMLLIQLKLGIKLSQTEQQMFLMPRVCELCWNPSQECLINCENCHCVSYCSIVHQEQDSERHKIICQELALCLSLDKYLLQAGDVYTQLGVPIPVQSKCESLPADVELFVKTFVPVNDFLKWNQHYKIALISELLSCPLTLIYSLETLYMNMRNLQIHVVGAGFLEFSYLKKWEVILHYIPELFGLNLVFIGPEVEQDLEGKCKVDLCEDCHRKHCELSLHYLCNTYHQFAISENYTRPDIIVAYNSGLHEFENSDNDSWGPSIPYLIKHEHVPLILTSYTREEAEKDIQRVMTIKERKIKIILNCQENPFSSKRPYRDWDNETNKVFYQNKFISIVKPRKL